MNSVKTIIVNGQSVVLSNNSLATAIGVLQANGALVFANGNRHMRSWQAKSKGDKSKDGNTEDNTDVVLVRLIGQLSLGLMDPGEWDDYLNNHGVEITDDVNTMIKEGKIPKFCHVLSL